MYSIHFDKVAPLQRDRDRQIAEVLDPTGQKLRADLELLQKSASGQLGSSDMTMLVGEAIKLVMQIRLSANRHACVTKIRLSRPRKPRSPA